MSVEYNKGTKSIIIDGRIIKELDSISRKELKQIRHKLSEYEKRRDSSKNPDYWQKKIDLLESSADTLTFPEINTWEKELEDPPPQPPLPEVEMEITDLYGQKWSPRGTITSEERDLEEMDIDYGIRVDDVADFDDHFTIDEYDAKIAELSKKQYEQYMRDPSETKTGYYGADSKEDYEWIDYYKGRRKKLLDAMSTKERSAYDYKSKRSVHYMTEDRIKRAENLDKELEVVNKELSTMLDNAGFTEDDFDYQEEINRYLESAP